ncbi:MAG TPA: Spy/CpxP family protein refolding chaperone [Stellaceae bacterium]|nr:Spy/CpxP family protein refolding chaperone [Stellaceae bacterium]
MTEPTLRAGRAAAFLFGALLVLPVAIAPAAAQQPAAPSPQAGAPPAGSPMEPRIQQLHQMLHITPAQQADFNAFAAAMRHNEATLRSLIEQRPPAANTNAVESLRFEQKLASAQAEGLERLIDPFARLYAALSPAQKNTANQIFTAAPATPPHRR